MAFTFQLEEPGTSVLGRETGRADPWAETFVQIAYSSGMHLSYPVDKKGQVRVTPASKELCAAVVQVFTNRPHRAPFRWRILNVGDAVAKEGGYAVVKVGARLRLSLISFPYPFQTVTKGSNGKLEYGGLNTKSMDKAKEAGFDDVTCVYGLTRVEGSSKVELTDPVIKLSHWKKLISEMHGRGIGVIIGYSMGSLEEEISPYERSYGKWFEKDTTNIKKHVEGILKYLRDNSLYFDGLCFDIESNAIREQNPKHVENLKHLIKTAAEILGEAGMTVSYFTGPFTSKDKKVTGSINMQRFDYIGETKDFWARPMCYDGKKADDYSTVKNSIDYALRPKSNKGAGLHPSQLQMALWPGMVDKATKGASMETYCKKLLRPNRVGLCVYTLPQLSSEQYTILADSAKYNEWLNGPDQLHDLANEPLQSPRNEPTVQKPKS